MSNSHRRPMTSVDAAWLGMDRPTNLMVINSLLFFDVPIAFERLRSVLDTRLVRRFDRFHQRVVAAGAPGTGSYAWEDDPHFNLHHHLRRVALPAPGGDAALQALAGELMSDPLDRNRPLWRFYLIENVDGGCAVLGRIHHCIADGIALLQVLLSLTDSEPDAEPVPLTDEHRPKTRRARLFDLPLRLAARVAGQGLRAADALLNANLDLRAGADALLQKLESAGLLTATSAAIVAKLLILSPDRPSPYRGQMGGIKRVTWSNPLPLAEVKAISRATGATINDVLVAALAGALRRDLQARGADAGMGDLRAMVPINLRRPTDKLGLGNEFSLLYLALPVSLDGPAARLAAVQQRMQLLKNSPEPFLVYQILGIVGMLPGELAHQAVNWFADKASCVLTNVPGPRQTLYFAGAAIRRLLFWVPHSGDISMGLSIFSYAGSVTLGLDVDEALVPDPERIIEHFYAEMAELQRLAAVYRQAPPSAAYVDAGQAL